MRKWLIAVFALAACSGPTEKSDWELQNEAQLAPPEETVALPPYPAEQRLIEFSVAATSEFRFFIDAASISVGKEGVVRYTLVARNPAAADNVSFEGMRCTAAEVRTYAVGRDGGWMRRAGGWRSIEGTSVQRWYNTLYREYFCPQAQAITSPQEGILSLRRGGASITRSLTEDMPRGGGAR